MYVIYVRMYIFVYVVFVYIHIICAWMRAVCVHIVLVCVPVHVRVCVFVHKFVCTNNATNICACMGACAYLSPTRNNRILLFITAITTVE